MIQIKHRYTRAVIFEHEGPAIKDAVIAAVLAGANLAGADLTGAHLADAHLAGAHLAGAYLKGADLRGANLADADLTNANLADASLAGAYLKGADLTGANFVRAYLVRANLARADLTDADLTDADLADANLARADLARAYLARADLTGADLTGADLTDADLALADLAGANLAGADLTGAYLARADLTGADLTGADLASASHYDPSTHIEPKEPYAHKPQRTLAERAADYRARHPGVPVIERLDAKILAVLDAGKGTLDMKNWHSCETTHCRAGWAIHLAGPAGYKLEQELGDPAMAGRAIYRASTGRSPHFYADDKAATEDMRRCAAEDAMTVAPDVGSLAAEETKS